MANRKYIKDYTLTHSVDKKGRYRTGAEYTGDLFTFREAPEPVRRQGIRAAIACGIAWAAWIGSLFLNTGAMRCFYISLPYVFTALALWHLSSSVVTILTAKPPLYRRQSHQVSMIYPPAALWSAALPAVSLLGLGITAALGKGSFNTQDIWFAVLGAIPVVCACFCFSLRKTFVTEKQERKQKNPPDIS